MAHEVEHALENLLNRPTLVLKRTTSQKVYYQGAVSKLLLTEFGIHHRLESCALYIESKPGKLSHLQASVEFWRVEVEMHEEESYCEEAPSEL